MQILTRNLPPVRPAAGPAGTRFAVPTLPTGLELDEESHDVRWGEGFYHLTPLQWSIFKPLWERRTRVVSCESLASAAGCSIRHLSVQLAKMRATLRPTPITMKGVDGGIRLTVSVAS